jgi:hypothetical protein
MNWYAYKLLAEAYDADRRREAQAHRRARTARRRVHRTLSARRGTPGWRSLVSAIRNRRPSAAAPTSGPVSATSITNPAVP